MSKRTFIVLAALIATSLSARAQSPALGLNFAATDPDAATSALAPEEFAGVVPQANWNNLVGASGTTNSLVFDRNGTSSPSSVSVTWSSPNTWRSGGNNLFSGSDQKLLSGYLDTGDTAANGISLSITNIDADIASGGYDVYVYFVSDSNADRGGAYTINPGAGPIVKYGSTMGSPTDFVEDPGTDANISQDGNYLKFTGLTGTAFTLTTDTTLTTPNGFRAPINAIQIVPTVPFGPDITTQPRGATVFSGRTVSFNAEAAGFPAVNSLRWQKNGTDLTESARIIGVSSNRLTIVNATAADAGTYTLVATSSRGNATSEGAVLAIATPDNSDYETTLLQDGPLAYWRLNEPAGVTQVFDFVGGLTGAYAGEVVHGDAVPGPRPTEFPGFSSTNTAAQFNAIYATTPTPALNTNAVTLITWIQPAAAQADYTGLFMTRSGTAAGLGYTTENQLGYTWNNNSTWSWNSGLRPPDGEWSMVALVIQSGRATLYLGTGGTLTAAINPIPHTPEVWGGEARIGDDTGGTGRFFNGIIDEVAVFNKALSFQQIAALYEDATGVPQATPPTISPQPLSATRYAGADVTFTSGAAGENITFQWQRNGTNISNGARITGATSESLTISGITAADAGTYTLVATNPTGPSTSDPAELVVVTPANAYVTDLLALDPLSYYRLNDADTGVASDLWGGHNGAWGAAATPGEGPNPVSGYARFEADNAALQGTSNTADAWVTVPGPGISTNTITFLAWINPATLVPSAGIVFARAGQPATGLNLNGSGNLGYHWLDAAGTYGFVSGLVPPLNQWSLVAVVVEPTQATLHMINAAGARSAVAPNTHAVRAFTDDIRIGGDPNSTARNFDGRIDEVAIFPAALTTAQLQSLYNQALGVIAPTIVTQPAPTTKYAGSTATLSVAASGTPPLTYRWQKNNTDLTEGGNISGVSSNTLTINNLTSGDAANYRVVVSNAQGNATSDAAALTVLPAPPAPGQGTFGNAVLSSGPVAYWRFNETGDPTSGNLEAFDYAGGHHALYGVAAANASSGITGPVPSEGFTQFEQGNAAFSPTINLADSWVTAPPLGVTTDRLTILAWINPITLVPNAGIVFARAGQPATGLNLNGTGNLGYHWLDTAATYNWDSGLTPQVGQWSLVAVSVQPNLATVYLITPQGVQSASVTNTHAARAFSDAIRIGGDPNNVNRTFDGSIDEVAIYDTALSADQIQAIYNGQAPQLRPELAITRGQDSQISVSWTGPGTLQSTTALQGAATTWTNENTTGNTFTTAPTGTAKFFRLVQGQ